MICRSITLQQGGTQTSAAAGEPEHAGHTHNLDYLFRSISRGKQAKPSQLLDLPRRPVPRLRARGVRLLLAGPVGLESARVALQRASLAGERGGG